MAYYSLEDARQAKIDRDRNVAAVTITGFIRRFFGKNLLLPLVEKAYTLEAWYGEPMIPRQFERKWFLAELYLKRGSIVSAQQEWRKLAEGFKTRFGDEHEATGCAHVILAQSLLAAGHRNDAVRALDLAVRIKESRERARERADHLWRRNTLSKVITSIQEIVVKKKGGTAHAQWRFKVWVHRRKKERFATWLLYTRECKRRRAAMDSAERFWLSTTRTRAITALGRNWFRRRHKRDISVFWMCGDCGGRGGRDIQKQRGER